KGIGIGGSAAITLASVGLISGGIYFIKKTNPNDLRKIIEEDKSLSFEDFMNKYPKQRPGFLREIFSEKELTDKFLEYVRNKKLSYSTVIRSFCGVKAFADDQNKNNPWGLIIGFVSSKALEELAIKEIESILTTTGNLTPEMIYNHFENDENIASPI